MLCPTDLKFVGSDKLGPQYQYYMFVACPKFGSTYQFELN